MKKAKLFFRTAQFTFFWLWFFSLVTAVWTGFGLAAWFLPYHTWWIVWIRQQTILYLLLGFIIHAVTLLSHQQYLFLFDRPTPPHTNLTFGAFFRKIAWLLVWNSPFYLLFAFMIRYSYAISFVWKSISALALLYRIPLLFLLALVLFILPSLCWIGCSELIRKQDSFAFPAFWSTIQHSFRSFATQFSFWLTVYALLTGIILLICLCAWSYRLLGPILYINPKDWFSPEKNLLLFILICIGLESFIIPVFSIASHLMDQSDSIH